MVLPYYNIREIPDLRMNPPQAWYPNVIEALG